MIIWRIDSSKLVTDYIKINRVFFTQELIAAHKIQKESEKAEASTQGLFTVVEKDLKKRIDKSEFNAGIEKFKKIV